MTNYFNNKQYFTSTCPVLDGCEIQFTFPNGYVASVLRHSKSYGGFEGLWEIAVMYNNEIVYDTPITSDVLGWQTNENVEKVLNQIRKLPERIA